MQDSELKKKRQQKDAAPKTLDERTVRENIIAKMVFAVDPLNEYDIVPHWPEFARRFHFYKPAPNVEPFCIEINERDVCTVVTEQDVVDAIVAYYTTKVLPHENVKDLAYGRIKDIFLKYRAVMPVLTDIKKVAFKSDKGFTWHRLDFDLEDGQRQEIPFFRHQYLARMTNSDAVCAWIGSLFIPTSDRSQYVWLYGKGRNGKGRLAHFLDRIFGEACTPFSVPKKSAAKGQENLVAVIADKRLAICEDCGEYYFVTDAFFKRLTGGGTQTGEIKFRMAAKMKTDVKFWFDSNEEPGIKGEAADLRRCIYATLPPIPDNEPVIPQAEMDARLWAERAGIIAYCIAKYWELCPREMEAIPCEHDEIMALVNNNEEELIDIADRFVFGPDLACKTEDISSVLRQCGIHHLNSKPGREFKRYVERFGVDTTRRRKRYGDNSYWVWTGMALVSDQPEPHEF